MNGIRLSDKFIEIDGAKDPDAIPSYLAWEHAFRVLKKGTLGRRSSTLQVSGVTTLCWKSRWQGSGVATRNVKRDSDADSNH
jgi:hypothetical protein